MGVTHEPDRRLAPRTPAVGRAALTAVECRRMPNGASVDATVLDISTVGVGVLVSGILDEGDRLAMAGRFFGVALEVEVEVASVRLGPMPGQLSVGCVFSAAMTGEQRIALERVVLARVAQDDLGLGARFALGG
jgi:PilZ domain